MTETIHTVEPIDLLTYDSSAPAITILRGLATMEINPDNPKVREVPCYAVDPYTAAGANGPYGLMPIDERSVGKDATYFLWKPFFDIRTDAYYGDFASKTMHSLEQVEQRGQIANADNSLYVDSLDHLNSLLLMCGISTENWQPDDCQKLMDYINEGNITLHEHPEGGLIAATSPTIINVYYEDREDPIRPIYELHEIKRVLYDADGNELPGNMAPRSRNSMGETRHIKPGAVETPYEAALRGFKEELGIEEHEPGDAFELLRATASVLQPPRSHDAFKGLATEYRLDYFVATISPDAYRPFYKEIKEGPDGRPVRKSVFGWQMIADERNAWDSQAS